MFDAKSILESIVRGAASQTQQGGGGGGLGDILGQLSKMTQSAGGGAHGQGSGGGLGGGLGDILAGIQRQMSGGGQGGGQGAPAPGAQPQHAPAGGGGGLGDILGQLKDQLGKAGGAMGGAQGAGGLADILKQVMGQAGDGVREGAGKIGQATGASDALGRAMGGQSPEDLLRKLQDLMRDNPLASAGAAAGVGGAVLGTRTGRAIAGQAVKLGALALIGGLAYKAFQNYQAGRPLITGASPLEAAPQGSGFEQGAVSNEAATLYIRGMIAAAAADGRIDAAEQAKLTGTLSQMGAGSEAEEFIANEMNNPATVEQLAEAVSSPEEAVQLYTAARIAIEPDSPAEQRFLAGLAGALGIDSKLAAHIEAQTRGAAAA